MIPYDFAFSFCFLLFRLSWQVGNNKAILVYQKSICLDHITGTVYIAYKENVKVAVDAFLV